MKRTIKVTVEVDSAEEHADVIHELTNHPKVIERAWTSHQDVKQILSEKYGERVKFGSGKIDEVIPD